MKFSTRFFHGVLYQSRKAIFLRLIIASTFLLFVHNSFSAGLMTPVGGNIPSLDIKEHNVTVVIEDGYAVTTVEQIFSNPNATDLEAIYSFPIPEKAAVSELTYWIDGKPVTGEVMEKKKAKQIYQEEKQAGRETALTEQDSYKTFDISVYPVRAQQDVKIRLTYIQPTHVDTAIGRYVYPLQEGGVDQEKLSFWTYNDAVKEKFSFQLLFRSSYPVDQLRLPQHPSAVVKKLSEKEWSVSIIETKNAQANAESAASSAPPASVQNLNKDIVVYWRLRDGLPGRVDMIAHKAPGASSGTFMMTLTPGDDLAPITEGRDWVFVLDYSGSMESKYSSLIEGVSKGLHKLNPNDRFKIIIFNDNASEITQGYQNATPEQVTNALQLLETYRPSGSTNLYAGVELAIKSLQADRSSGVILVTDGEANVGLTEKKDFLKLLEKRDVRLFTFVMGNSANRPLLEGMAKVSNGFAMNISNSDDIVGKLLEVTSKLTHQAYHDVDVKFSGVKVTDITPEKIGSLYRGQQLIIFGHYHGEGAATITISGKVSGQPKSYSAEFNFPKEDHLYPEIERLWAYAKIEDMEHKMDYFGKDADIVKAITDLAVEKSLVTDYTSMIIMRDEEFKNRGIERRNGKRVAEEQAAQQERQTTAVRNHRVDAQKPMFNNNAPTHNSGGGGSGGAIDLWMLILLLPFAILQLVSIGRGRQKG